MNNKIKDFIIIKGAREHNLKNISINIPKNKLVVLTGVSGSGKSSLAFNTIYAEGQRRYLDSLSAYVRQFMHNVNKPDVDSIEGLSPSISIDQKTISKNPRSTVATMTEIADYFRLLFSRIGIAFCPKHNLSITEQDIETICKKIKESYYNRKLNILAPVVMGKKGRHEKLLENLKKQGYIRIRINKKEYFLDNIPRLNLNNKYDIDVILDRIIVNEENYSRLFEGIELSFNLANRKVLFIVDDEEERFMSGDFSCPYCNFTLPSLEPNFFSFNGPHGGACGECVGLGTRIVLQKELFLINKRYTITELLSKLIWNIKKLPIYDILENSFNKVYPGIFNLPLETFDQEQINFFLYGNKKNLKFNGILSYLKQYYNSTTNEYCRYLLGKMMHEEDCNKCKGTRFSNEALSVLVNDKNIAQFNAFSVSQALEYFNNIQLDESNKKIAKLILKEIIDRLEFLNNVGLGYLTLNRRANTLSGGESQRIRLATQIGSKLTGIIYVLDEPSIGLHQKDNDKLIKTLKGIRDLGNTILVVEHDEDTIKASDYIVDIGPAAGIYGGTVVAAGSIEKIMKSPKSITGSYLSKKNKILVPSCRREGSGKFISIKGATKNNLKNINVEIPLATLTCITGVSGSGKSTLINYILANVVRNSINRNGSKVSGYKRIEGIEYIDKLITIDQSPIGRTPRSNPATYTGVFDDIRELFSGTPEAKAKGYLKGRFSFNLKGGRCENCKGEGVKKIEMHFLPDVFVTCDICNGKRYNNETLSVHYQKKNIYEILEMTMSTALIFFDNVPKIREKLKTICDIGLGYIKLGQFATTLSGGEAQRVKLASELYKKSTTNTLYILDEPTTGLHIHDIKFLIEALQILVNKGNTILIIEHNLDLIKVADYIIDLGPGGGINGGEVVGVGTPEELVKNKLSYTGKFLKPYLTQTQ